MTTIVNDRNLYPRSYRFVANLPPELRYLLGHLIRHGGRVDNVSPLVRNVSAAMARLRAHLKRDGLRVVTIYRIEVM